MPLRASTPGLRPWATSPIARALVTARVIHFGAMLALPLAPRLRPWATMMLIGARPTILATVRLRGRSAISFALVLITARTIRLGPMLLASTCLRRRLRGVSLALRRARLGLACLIRRSAPALRPGLARAIRLLRAALAPSPVSDGLRWALAALRLVRRGAARRRGFGSGFRRPVRTPYLLLGEGG